MLVDLAPDARAPLRPLFEAFPGLRGCLDAILEGAMGSARADHATCPSVAVLHLDFVFVAGDATSAAAEAALRTVKPPAYVVLSDSGWEAPLRRVWGAALGTRTRVAFRPGAWDRERLRGYIDALPAGYALKRIDRVGAGRFEELADSLVYNFSGLDDFIARGVGFGIEHEGSFVSGCSSFAISSRSLEFEIQTHPKFRRRGLATAAAAAMIEHCLDRGLEPCWDAHNEISAALAAKLGFVDPAPYTSHEVWTEEA